MANDKQPSEEELILEQQLTEDEIEDEEDEIEDEGDTTKKKKKLTLLTYIAIVLGSVIILLGVYFLFLAPDHTFDNEQDIITTALEEENTKSHSPETTTEEHTQNIANTNNITAINQGAFNKYPDITDFSKLDPAPIAELQIKTPYGLLPTISEDNRKPWIEYSKPYDNIRGVKVAVVIGPVGLSQSKFKLLLRKLPEEFTIALSPYVARGKDIGNVIRENGKEFLITLPVKGNLSQVDGGEYTISDNNEYQQNIQNIYSTLSTTSGYYGVLLWYEDRININKTLIGRVLDEIKEKGLVLINNKIASTKSELKRTSKAKQTPYAEANIHLGTELGYQEAYQKIKKAESKLSPESNIIVYSEANLSNIYAIMDWLSTIKEKGYTLVPLSYIMKSIYD